MSTRATISVLDSHEKFDIYKHHDGYPEWVLPYIKEAIKFAWKLPRFEASDFAAALIRVMKTSGWSVYLTTDATRHADREYHYDIRFDGSSITVDIQSIDIRYDHIPDISQFKEE